jgi:hypothetical protein
LGGVDSLATVRKKKDVVSVGSHYPIFKLNYVHVIEKQVPIVFF